MKKRRLVAVIAAGLTAGLAAVILVRTVSSRPRTPATAPEEPVALVDGAAERLAGAIRLATISHEDTAAFDATAFRGLHSYLQRAFPRVHTRLERETVGTHSLLYTWRGSDASLRPVLLAAHLDVVPVEPGTEPLWDHAPFGGHIGDGFVWGRGAIDNKSAVVAQLEAIEMLLGEGVRPVRTVHLAFGHDEEVGGREGARRIAELLRQRGVALEMVLDEGGVIGDGLLAGIVPPTALIGIAEKGFVSVELEARGAGGHSSLPARRSAIGALSAAITRLERQPMPARVPEPTRQLLDRIAPHLPVAKRATFTNLWLTRPLVLRALAAEPSTNAMIRTTAAITLFQAGTKDNVLPSTARAVVNFRIVQGDSVAGVLEHVRRAIDDTTVALRVAGRFSAEPSPVSDTASAGFRMLDDAVRRVLPGAVIAPYLVVVATDARHYAGLSASIFRFLPVRLGSGDLARVHGTDERIAIVDYERAVRFYRALILDAAR